MPYFLQRSNAIQKNSKEEDVLITKAVGHHIVSNNEKKVYYNVPYTCSKL